MQDASIAQRWTKELLEAINSARGSREPVTTLTVLQLTLMLTLKLVALPLYLDLCALG